MSPGGLEGARVGGGWTLGGPDGRTDLRFWAADPKGTMSYRTEGEFPSVRTNKRTNVQTNERPSVLSPKSPPPTPSRPQPPRPLDTLPRPVYPSRALAPHGQTEIPPLFYRTLSPSGLLPCLNFSIQKRTAQGQ